MWRPDWLFLPAEPEQYILVKSNGKRGYHKYSFLVAHCLGCGIEVYRIWMVNIPSFKAQLNKYLLLGRSEKDGETFTVGAWGVVTEMFPDVS